MTQRSVWLWLLIGLCALRLIWQWWRWHPRVSPVVSQGRGTRVLRPHTPYSCVECQQPAPPPAAPPRAVRLWKEVKSRRGRKKAMVTAGYACWNPECAYCGITDEAVHALVGYGRHGKTDRIQDLWCQACQTKVTERHHTALYHLKTAGARVSEGLAMLAEGLDVRAVVRVTGHMEATIQRWLTRAAMHAARVHTHFFQGLGLKHIQLDEIKARLRDKTPEWWVWVTLDVTTKLIPVLEVGARTQAIANRVVHRLKAILAPGCLPVFTSDRLRLYFYALTAHWGRWVEQVGPRLPQWQVLPELLYGQVIKPYRRYRVAWVEYRMQCGALGDLKARLKALGLRGRLNTAFVERVNLTIRQGVALLVRRTWGTAQTTGALRLHLLWWQGYYHFV